MNRRKLVLLGTGSVAVIASGLVATKWVKSPQQDLADAAPPEATMLTADVELRVLKDTVVFRGQVSAAGVIEVTPVPRDAGRAVLTGLRVKAGQEFAEGSVLLEVSGRPLIAFAGQVPAYRDLLPGVHGPDVAALQAALKSLGFDPRETGGTFGSGTKRELARFYSSVGYEPILHGDPRELAAAADRTRSARRALAEAEAELRRLLDSPPSPPPSGGAVREAERRVRYAKEDLAAAKAAHSQLEKTSGPMLPLSEVVFVPAFPARVVKLTAAIGAEVKAPLITVSGGDLVVRARLTPAQRSLLKEGMAAEIRSELLNVTARGEVASIGDLEPDEAGTRAHPMTVVPKEGKLASKLAGADVRLTIDAASTQNEVLVVPISAIFAGSDGRTAVTKLDTKGRQLRVIVTVGVSGDGYASVTPTEGDLRPGDKVVIGQP